VREQRYSFNSPAKINLGLRILNKRDDSYHNLNTIFCELRFGDEIQFTKSDKFELTTEGIDVPVNDSNLIVKVYKKLKAKTKDAYPEFKIHLIKQIPIGAGLGGGSSNAGVTIKALNKLWHLNMSIKEMESISADLGADIPFFINGGVQHATGIGEILNQIDSSFLKDKKVLLICPDFSISTVWAYKNINKFLNVKKVIPKFAPLEMPLKWQLFENDFEKVVKSTYPEIEEIIQTLKENALFAGLSGSGSTVYGIYDQTIDLNKIRNQFSGTYHTFETNIICNC
jgi:4-diphosphocytidyl-2-C-methyl-D-erythritol kinase